MHDPFAVTGPSSPRPPKTPRPAIVKWRIKGNNDGPVYQGTALIQPCVGCGNRGTAPAATERTWPDVVSFRPNVPTERPTESLVIYTLVYGSPPWLMDFLPSIRAWCDRIDVPLVEWSEIPADYPSPKFAEVDMIRHFLTGDAEWMMYVDADVYVHPLAPHPLHNDPAPGLYAREDVAGVNVRERWPAWVRQHFNRDPRPEYRYRNAGVWLIDRDTAAEFLRGCSPPFVSGQMEQHHFNLWLHDFTGSLHDLPAEWNIFANVPRQPITHGGWLYHCAGGRKIEALTALRERGFLPDPFPPADMSKWGESIAPRAVVIPCKLSLDPWLGESLRYAIRSIEQHLPDWPIYVLGDERPAWLDPAAFIHAPTYEDALIRGLSLADKVIWTNDDIMFLRDITPADVTPATDGMITMDQINAGLRSKNTWERNRMRLVMTLLHSREEIGSVPNFSTHTPYLFSREKSKSVLERVGITRKIAFEQAYFSDAQGMPVGDKKARPPEKDHPGKCWLNFHTRDADEDLRRWLAARYPRPSRLELASDH